MHSRNPTREELMWVLLYADDVRPLVYDDIDNLKISQCALMDSTVHSWTPQCTHGLHSFAVGTDHQYSKTKVLVVSRDAGVNAVIIIWGNTNTL